MIVVRGMCGRYGWESHDLGYWGFRGFVSADDALRHARDIVGRDVPALIYTRKSGA